MKLRNAAVGLTMLAAGACATGSKATPAPKKSQFAEIEIDYGVFYPETRPTQECIDDLRSATHLYVRALALIDAGKCEDARIEVRKALGPIDRMEGCSGHELSDPFRQLDEALATVEKAMKECLERPSVSI